MIVGRRRRVRIETPGGSVRPKDQTKRDLRAAGLCIDCRGVPWRPGAWRCRPCQDVENLRQRVVLDETRAFGLCYACGRDAKPGRIRCAECTAAGRRPQGEPRSVMGRGSAIRLAPGRLA